MCCPGSPLFSLKYRAIKRYYLTTEYAVHFISGTVEGNGARAVMLGGLPTWTHIDPLWSHYSKGTKLQLKGVLSQVIDHSLGPLSSVLSAHWSLRNTNEGNPVSAITTLNEALGIKGFIISITWSCILNQWKEFNKGRAMTFLVDEWVTPDVGKRRQGRIPHAAVNYKRYWVTSKNSSWVQYGQPALEALPWSSA